MILCVKTTVFSFPFTLWIFRFYSGLFRSWKIMRKMSENFHQRRDFILNTFSCDDERETFSNIFTYFFLLMCMYCESRQFLLGKLRHELNKSEWDRMKMKKVVERGWEKWKFSRFSFFHCISVWLHEKIRWFLWLLHTAFSFTPKQQQQGKEISKQNESGA